MRKALWMWGACAWALSAAPAWAQQQQTDQDGDAAQATDGSTAEAGAVSDQGVTDERETDAGDVIVTATRRNEALSDVPLSVSAVTADTLENSGTTDIRQLTQLSPSLLVSSTSSEAGAGVARIRGVGTVGDNPGLESSVAVFIDGVYRSRTGVALTELGQIERVEVLRGPQGTLFGRNASAGLLSIITARPRFEFGVNAQATYGNYDMIRGELGVTGPISETIAFRVDGTYLERDGYIRDVISGRTVNNRDRYLLRGQLLFQPTEQLQVRIIGDYADRDEECCAAPYLPAFDTTFVGGVQTTQPSSIAALQRALGAVIRDDTFSRRVSITPGIDYAQKVEDFGGSGEIVYDFGGAEFTSITAYRVNDYLRGQDADFNNLDILRRLSDGGANQKFETFTQELRLQGELFNGRVDALIGGYFANEDLTVRDNLQYGADFERFANVLLFNGLVAQGLPNFAQPLPTGTGVNSALLTGAQAQANAGVAQLPGAIAQVQAGIAGLSAIPNRTPAQNAQLAGLQTQLVTLNTQLAQARGAAPLLNALNANPARPGFGSLAAAFGQPAGGLNLRGQRDLYEQNSRNFAFFTHNIVKITDQLNLTLGLRYTNERKTLDATFTDNNSLCNAIAASPLNALQTLACVIPSVPGGNLALENNRRTEDALSGTAVVSWKPSPETLLYGSYSRGYKAGGFNLDRSALIRSIAANGAAGPITSAANLDQLEFESEQVDAFELGAKYNGQGFDVNVSLFHQLFDDFQLNTFNGINFIVENVNSCSRSLGGADRDNSPTTGACTGKVEAGLRSRGIEIETFLRPNPDFNFNLGASYIDTTYRDDLVGIEGRALAPVLFQLPGRRISNSSEYTLSGSATATPRIGDSGLSALFYIDGRFQSRINTGSDLDLEKLQEAVITMNARLGIRGPDNRWGVEAFVQNLTDEDYLQVGFDAPLQGNGTIRAVRSGFQPRATQLFGGFLAEPRTYGVTVRGRF